MLLVQKLMNLRISQPEDAKAGNEPRRSRQAPGKANGWTGSHAENNDKFFSYAQNTSNLTRDVINHNPRLTPQARTREPTTRNFADNPKISSGNSEETRKMLYLLIRDIGDPLHWESKIGFVDFSLEIFWEGRIFFGAQISVFGSGCFSLKHNIPCPVQPASPQPHSLATKRSDENREWRIELFSLDSCTPTDLEL